MYESHEKLKGMKTKSADLGKTLREKRRELEDEQRKNQLLERDVERFKNRQKYMSRIGHLKKKKLWVVSEGLGAYVLGVLYQEILCYDCSKFSYCRWNLDLHICIDSIHTV